jgi:hypothetical protein
LGGGGSPARDDWVIADWAIMVRVGRWRVGVGGGLMVLPLPLLLLSIGDLKPGEEYEGESKQQLALGGGAPSFARRPQRHSRGAMVAKGAPRGRTDYMEECGPGLPREVVGTSKQQPTGNGQDKVGEVGEKRGEGRMISRVAAAMVEVVGSRWRPFQAQAKPKKKPRA